MGKYTDLERVPRDYYPTPLKGVVPLVHHLQNKTYIEPCAGDGRLVEHIKELVPSATCAAKLDLEPQAEGISQGNALEIDWEDRIDRYEDRTGTKIDCFVTNPPWINDNKSGYQLNTLIKTLSKVRPTWLLMNGNYVFNKKSAECMRMCSDVVPVGRLIWIEGTKMAGKEDCAWFRFDSRKQESHLTYIHPRD